MKVTYNGTSGELVKLERKVITTVYVSDYKSHTHSLFRSSEEQKTQHETKINYSYDLTIYDPEKKATVHFENVNLADVKFSGGEVSFNG